MKLTFTFLLSIVLQVSFSQDYYYREVFFKNLSIDYIKEMKVEDMNGDGSKDFVLVSHDDKKIFVGLNYNLAAPIFKVVNQGDDIRNVIVFDFDGDGDKDIIGSSPKKDTTFLWRNKGNASFKEEMLPLGKYDAIHFADLDGDGTNEMMVGQNDGVSIYSLANGEITFLETLVQNSFHGSADGISTYDKNGDGLLDIIACFGFGGIKIMEQPTKGEWVSSRIIKDSYNNSNVKMVEVNGDKYLDILAFSEYNRTTEVFINNGDDTFEKTSLASDIGVNVESSFGDIDNDGDIDVLFFEKQSSGISIYDNDSGEFTKHLISNSYMVNSNGGIADLDGDGEMDLYCYTKNGSGLLLLIKEDMPSSVDSYPNAQVNVYPNPALDFLQIDIKLGNIEQVKLINIHGKTVYFGKTTMIDLSDVRSGLYIVNIRLKSGDVIEKKVVVQGR